MSKKLEAAYGYYNRKYFGGLLPKISVRWSNDLPDGRVKGHKEIQFAEFNWSSADPNDGEILLAAWMRSYNAIWRMHLLHEMSHVQLREDSAEIKSSCYTHSRKWKKVMRDLAAAGAFDNLW